MCMSEVGHVIEVDGRHATVDMMGHKRRVTLDALQLEGELVEPGQDLLIHTGFAVAILGSEEAAILAGEIAEVRRAGGQR